MSGIAPVWEEPLGGLTGAGGVGAADTDSRSAVRAPSNLCEQVIVSEEVNDFVRKKSKTGLTLARW